VILRRKRLPPELAEPYAAFEEVASLLAGAKASLTSVMPTTRLSGTPPAEALIAFEEILGRAAGRMAGWRAPAVEDTWQAAAAGVRTSLERARLMREDPPDINGFEGLIWAVGELLDPLDAFEAAETRFRELRSRSG
jgi:hypothetical protein